MPLVGSCFATALARRGPYEPWALLLDREALIAAGARPVLYLSDEELLATDGMPARFRGRRVRYEPGSEHSHFASGMSTRSGSSSTSWASSER